MKTLTWTFEEKYEYPNRGVWDSEVDKKQWRDEHTGLPCLIRRGPLGALCGYVGVPRDHPCFGKGYDNVDVRVHGGLTYSDFCQESEHGVCHVVEDGEDDRVWWLGFDCGHLGDFVPGMDRWSLHGDGDAYRDIAYVTAEVESLARQLRGQGNSIESARGGRRYGAVSKPRKPQVSPQPEASIVTRKEKLDRLPALKVRCARKRYQCSRCKGSIQPGQVYAFDRPTEKMHLYREDCAAERVQQAGFQS